MESVKCLLLAIVIGIVVAGDDVSHDTLETGTDEKHLTRGARSIISAIVDGLKNIHSNLHNKAPVEDAPANSLNIDTADSDDDDDLPSYGDSDRCRIEYIEVESVHYSEVMTKECRSHNLTSCNTSPYEECHDQLREECHQSVREECHDKLEEECHTQYRTEHSQEAVRECDRKCQYRWEGTDEDKRWVVDTATCTCEDITRQTVARVPYLNCSLVSRKECEDVPVRECEEVKEMICEQKEKEECKEVPHRECKDIHRRVPNTITRNMPVQVCKEELEGRRKEMEREGRQESEQEQDGDSRNPRGIQN